MRRAHALLDELEIPHRIQDGPQRNRHWAGGWLEDAATQLAELSR